MKLFSNTENGIEHLYFGLELAGSGSRPFPVNENFRLQKWLAEQDAWRKRFALLLTSPPYGKTLDLLLTGGGVKNEGRLRVYLFCKIRVEDTKAAKAQLKIAWNDLYSLLHSNRNVYFFRPVTKKKDLFSYLRLLKNEHTVEFCRRGLSVSLENSIGFHSAGHSQIVSALPFPFEGSPGDLGFLCHFLVEQPQQVVVLIRAVPHEGGLPDGNFSLLQKPRDKISLDNFSRVKDRALDITRNKLDLCRIRVFLSAEKGLSEPLINVFGSELLTDKSNYCKDRDHSPDNLAVNQDLLNLYSAEEGARVFRLPLPGNNGLPGLPLAYPYIPKGLPANGAVLGFKQTDQGKFSIRISEADRDKHLYVLGQTGTGKTTLLYSMAMSDIREGRGVCVLDPHDDLHEKLIARIPDYRRDDVILLDPNDFDYTVGLNLLEGKTERENSFLANELIQIIRKIYDPTAQGIVGPIFEQAVRSAALTAMMIPGGGTVVDIPLLLGSRDYAGKALDYIDDKRLKYFWHEVWFKREREYAEMLAYITSKFDNIAADPYMRRTLGQSKSAINFRQIMDEGKILLVNLSKGALGEMNSHLLGSILVVMIFSAALSRYDLKRQERRPFYLYIDEFQNFTTDTTHNILSEARKYGLSLVLAHQNLRQLSEKTRHIVLGNVGSLIFFRPGPQDATYVKDYLAPDFSELDLLSLPNWSAIGRLMINATPARPFVFEVDKDRDMENRENLEYVRAKVRRDYARYYKDVEDELLTRQELSDDY